MAGNSFGARAGLDVGDRSLEVFRLDALGSVGDVGGLPFSLKVLLENLLRNEDGSAVTAEDVEAFARWDPAGGRGPGDRLLAGPGADAGLHRRAGDRRPGRHARRHGRPSAATRPGSTRWPRPSWSSTTRWWPTSPGGPTPSSATSSWSSSATRSATRSCAGASRPSPTSRWCRPAPASCHQINCEYLARVVFTNDQRPGLPRHPGRHRQPHPDGQRPRRARLGRRRHRGRGGHARPADLDAHAQGRRVQAVGRAARGLDRHRPGPDRDRAAAPPRGGGQVRRVLRPRGRQRAGREPGHHRQHVARVRLDLRHLPDRRRDPALPPLHRPPARAGRPGRGVRQGAGPVARPGAPSPATPRRVELDLGTVVPEPGRAAPAPGPGRPRPTPAAASGPPWPTWPPSRGHADTPATAVSEDGPDEASAESFPASDPPAAMAGTAAHGRQPRPAPRPAGSSPTRPGPAAGPASRGAGRPRGRHQLRPRPRARGHRRHHQLHQHLQPVGDAGRRAAGPQGRRARPRLQAVGQDLAGPRVQGGHGLPTSGPGCCRTSRSSASTWSASAAPPASATPGPLAPEISQAVERARPGGGLGAVRQPQLRGPHQPRLPHELPGLAAAGGRLRPGRDDGHRPARRAARPRPRRQPRLPARPLAVQRRGGRADRPGRPVGHVPQELRPRCSTGDERWNTLDGADRGELRLGRRLDLRAPAALLRRHAGHPRAGDRHPRRPGPGRARRQRHHRPHLARRGHQARQPGRPLPDRAGRRACGTSTPTARGGATTR